MRIFPVRGQEPAVGKNVLRLGLAASLLISVAAPPLRAGQSKKAPLGRPQEFIFLLPEGFKGWVCVDFGVTGAAPLPREGNAFVIRPRQGEVLATSDKAGDLYFGGEAWYEVNGQRRPLPDDVTVQLVLSNYPGGKPTQRHCAFVGTTDEREAAGNSAPGFEDFPQQNKSIPVEERKALEALYKSTDGDHWKHHVGWLGAAGTECVWHGIRCGSPYDPPSVTDIDLPENNLSGAIPEALAGLTHLQRINMDGNKLSGTIPEALAGLTHLESISIAGNNLSGRLPDAFIKKWLLGQLWIIADPSAFTDVTEVDYESSSTMLLCARDRIILRSDGGEIFYSERCRNKTPQDRATFCEVKGRRISGDEFGTLAVLLEKNQFYSFRRSYSRSVTDSGFFRLRVIRGGKTYEVVEYAGGSPYEFWIIKGFIDSFMWGDDWEGTRSIPQCPLWEKGRVP